MSGDLSALEPLLPAELRILAALRLGDFDRLGDGSLPTDGDPDRVVRAELLRFLLLGGDGAVKPHEKGVRVSGGWITGQLDLEGCRIPRDIGLKDCHFEAAPVLRSAIIDNLFLDGSEVPGIEAERLEARGGLTVRGARITGVIRLAGAAIGGSLECDGAVLEPGAGQTAIAAAGLRAEGVLLRGAQVRGGIDLSGARLVSGIEAQGLDLARPDGTALNADSLVSRSNVVLRRASIVGGVLLGGALIEGDLDCNGTTFSNPGAMALDLGRAIVEGGFLLADDASVAGIMDLTGARFGTLHDAASAWPAEGDLLLNRCLYGGFIDAPVDATDRLAWLGRQRPERWGEDFWPQPFEQLAMVLRQMGHGEDARTVLIEKERQHRAVRRARTTNPFWRTALAAKDLMLGITLGYGLRPLLACVWLALFWAGGAVVFAHADSVGALKPNSAVVLRSPEWTTCRIERGRTVVQDGREFQGRADPGQTPLACFRTQFEAASYPEFNALMYSLDTLFPVLEIGQRNYWRPDPAQPFGGVTIWYFYLESVIGWVLSLLAVAGFSGLVKSN
ncbi:MAG: hypothetical protein ACOYOJ_13205 [Alsobacter sp.]